MTLNTGNPSISRPQIREVSNPQKGPFGAPQSGGAYDEKGRTGSHGRTCFCKRGLGKGVQTV
jgi:hypothetical protein